MMSRGSFVSFTGSLVRSICISLTFDLDRWSVVAGFHQAAQEDGDVGYFAGAEDGGMLCVCGSTTVVMSALGSNFLVVL